MNNIEIATAVSLSIAFDCEKARHMFIEKFNKEPPPARTLLDWKKHFLETLSVWPRPHASDQSSKRLSSVKRDEVVQAFGEDPNTSQRKVPQQCEVSLSSVNQILRRRITSMELIFCMLFSTKKSAGSAETPCTWTLGTWFCNFLQSCRFFVTHINKFCLKTMG